MAPSSRRVPCARTLAKAIPPRRGAKRAGSLPSPSQRVCLLPLSRAISNPLLKHHLALSEEERPPPPPRHELHDGRRPHFTVLLEPVVRVAAPWPVQGEGRAPAAAAAVGDEPRSAELGTQLGVWVRVRWSTHRRRGLEHASPSSWSASHLLPGRGRGHGQEAPWRTTQAQARKGPKGALSVFSLSLASPPSTFMSPPRWSPAEAVTAVRGDWNRAGPLSSLATS